jgi:hypothetical protein
MLVIERFAGTYVEHKYLELIPVYIIVQLVWFCQALNMELSGRDKWRARSANAEWPL